MNPWRGLGGLPREVWILSGATLLNRMGTMALPFLALYATQGMGFSPARAGEAMLAYGAAALVAAPLGGHLSDRIGSLRVMRISLTLSALLMIAISFARSWPAMLALVMLWALAGESFRPASMAILTDLAPEDRRKAVFSLNRLAINLGMSIGPVLGGLLAQRSFHALFWTDGATSLGAALVLLFAIRSDPSRHSAEHPPRHPFTALADRRLSLFLLALIPVMVVFLQHEGALPVFLVEDLGFTPAFYGSLFTLNTALIVLLEVRINLATAHWPSRRTLMLGALLTAGGFGALAFLHGRMAIWATVLVWTFGEMTLMPAMSDHVAHLAPPERRGEYMGLFSMAVSVAFTIGPWFGLLLLGRYGPTTLWIFMGLFGALSALAFWRVVSTSDPRLA
ncbi:MAG TPA: MFS transporter [Holophagaceae bacterium]|nr:MFS transporter [Holophagaceae bacterium]